MKIRETSLQCSASSDNSLRAYAGPRYWFAWIALCCMWLLARLPYPLQISPPIADYPSGDDAKDATRINTIIEQAVRQYPDQYLWLHKRFKTQAAGKAARPY